MTSTLPNFSANSAVAGSHSISPADLNSAGASPADDARDFADLMPPPKEKARDQPAENSSPRPSSIHALRVNEAGEVSPAEAADGTTDDSGKEVSRDTLEQAAAFVSGLLQTLLPEVAVPALVAGGSSMTSAAARRDAGPPEGSPAMEGPRPCGPGSTGDAAGEAGSAIPSYNCEVAYAADGAVEITLDLPQAKNADGKADPAGMPVEIQAELELPGQAVMRLQANGSFSPGGQAQSSRANFAGKKDGPGTGVDSLAGSDERNFVFTGDKPVKARPSEAGIAVAKSDATMPTALLDETRATSNQVTHLGLPAHGEFSVAWPSAERTGETAAAPIEANFAERAVATVTGLVDAQFSASMQKSGSVQLKLKFGGEDLSVRVELRGGTVHTDFRTDSAELRAALTREMQAVAGQSPEQTRRYLLPVFSPASSSSSGDSYPQSGRQQQAAQQDLSQRAPRPPVEEAAPFAHRSLLRDSFFPEPVAPRVPVRLPTSLRLSALA